MIQYKTGDLRRETQGTFVIFVNCVGVPGKGIALWWANLLGKEYPSVKEYKRMCAQDEFYPGKIHIQGGFILMATKDHWCDPSQLKWIRSGLLELAEYAHENPGIHIIMGKPGCGLGGLSWDEVGPFVRRYLGEVPCTVSVYIQEGDRRY